MRVYFHVVIALKSHPKTFVFLLGDLSEHQLKRDFILPYQKGGAIMSNNSLIALSDISSVWIRSTEEDKDASLLAMRLSNDEATERFNRQSQHVIMMPGNFGYNDEDIVHSGKDVTRHYISGPPGTGTALSNLIGWLNNPWLVTVIGGAIVVVIATFLLS